MPLRAAEQEATRKDIEFYICPTPGCPDYFGSSTMPSLETAWTGPKAEDRGILAVNTGSPHRHNRAECPTCRTQGRSVQRMRMRITVGVPKEGPPTPPLPQIDGQLRLA